MSYLLEVYRDKATALKGKNNLPLFAEVEVSSESAPYLVSGAKAPLLWVEKPYAGEAGDVVKAGIRDIKSPGEMFLTVLLSVESRGRRDNWGNVHPFTAKGLQAAIDHVSYHDLGDLEVLVPRLRGETNPNEEKPKGKKKPKPKVAAKKRPAWLHPNEFQLPFRPTSWLPEDCAVVVPKQREFVGRLTHLGVKTVFVVVHNPGRGIGIARSAPTDDLAR